MEVARKNTCHGNSDSPARGSQHIFFMRERVCRLENDSPCRCFSLILSSDDWAALNHICQQYSILGADLGLINIEYKRESKIITKVVK